jgi:thioredoxin reductase
MQFWSQLANAGGERFLKSFCFGTNIPALAPGSTFADYNEPRGLETFEPCSFRNFVDYGLWFAKRHVERVETINVARIGRRDQWFAIELESGEPVIASRVIVATGLAEFARIPEEYLSLAPNLVEHTSTIENFSGFRGADVAVVGAGQSALEAAALLHEAGARPQLIFRKPSIMWMTRTPREQSLWQRIRSPVADLGTGPKAWALTKFPGAMHRVPASLRVAFLKRHLPPEGAWWLRPRVEQRVSMHSSARVLRARERGGRVVLTVAQHAPDRTLSIEVDKVVVGTGYTIDVDKLGFIEPGLCAAVDRIERAPRLNSNFESSVPGLYFVGPASAMSFGPLFRFVAGSRYTSSVVARHVARASS